VALRDSALVIRGKRVANKWCPVNDTVCAVCYFVSEKLGHRSDQVIPNNGFSCVLPAMFYGNIECHRRDLKIGHISNALLKFKHCLVTLNLASPLEVYCLFGTENSEPYLRYDP